MLESDNTTNDTTEAPQTEPAPAEADATAKPAKKTPAKRAAKKAPAKSADTADAKSDDAPAAAKKAPAKRAAKKAPAKKSKPVAEEPSAETLAETPVQPELAPAAFTPPGVLFKAPVEIATELAVVELVEAVVAESELTDEEIREVAIDEAAASRKRRRRGRRGRGGASRSSAANADDDEDDDVELVEGVEPETADGVEAEDADADDSDEDSEDGGDESGSSTTKRRRRRRRSGSGNGGAAAVDGEDDPPNTVVHVRPPREADDGVKAVKGSTRLEAKRQRRRDGRDNSRRRPPILSEAEFLARREAVDRVMAVRQRGDRTQIAVLEDDVLVEHYVTRASTTSYVGNIYLGRVQNVLPSMEAAFIDISKGRNGVLYAGEVNWDATGLEGKSRNIETALKSGDVVLVQVTKDPIGHKGARLTSQISLPGRFLVYVPGGGMTGISRKLPDTERHRLKSILKKIVPEDAGVIIRTAAEGATEEELTHDVQRLQAQWELIQAKAEKTSTAPTLVHGEPDLAIRVVRDVFNEDFKKLVVEGDGAWATISEYVDGVAPDLRERVSRHVSEKDLFHELRVDEQLMKALDRKVWLPSGGSLVIDRTEAMTVIDVNTGKFVGTGGNLEQTVTRNNIEAAEEIVRQLRLRDVGGIVVIDFIDMVLESNRELVLRRLTECLGRDRTKHQVAEVTSLGLVQMTRKRVGEGLLEAFSEPCEHCRGRGVMIHTEPVDKTPGDAPSFYDDEDRGPSKSRRKRGGSGSGSGSGNTAKKAEPVEPPEDAEARERRLAAMAKIHQAAAHGETLVEEAEGRLETPGLSSVETSDLSEAAVINVFEELFEATEPPAAFVEALAEAAAEPVAPTVVEPVAPTAVEIQEAAEDEVDPMLWLDAEAETLAAEAELDAQESAPARPRRRRGASRPAGPPGGS